MFFVPYVMSCMLRSWFVTSCHKTRALHALKDPRPILLVWVYYICCMYAVLRRFFFQYLFIKVDPMRLPLYSNGKHESSEMEKNKRKDQWGILSQGRGGGGGVQCHLPISVKIGIETDSCCAENVLSICKVIT